MKRIITFLTMCFVGITFAQDGVLDASFGTNGYVLINGINIDFNKKLETDGKIIYLSGTTFHRLNTDGTLDTTFGTNGNFVITQPVTNAYGFLRLPTIDKIAVFTSTTSGSVNTYYMGRYNLDGSIDTTFGVAGSGYIVINAGNIKSGVFPILSLDNKILLGGNSISSGGSYNNIVINRYSLDGIIDYTYNSALTAGFNISTSSQGYSTNDIMRGIHLLSDNKVVANYNITYYATTGTEGYKSGFLVQTPGVTYPASYQNAYQAYYDSTKSNITIDSNNKIYSLSGSYKNSSNTFAPTNFIYKKNSSGALDQTFGTSGIITPVLNIPIYGIAYYQKILVQSDGKILAAGETTITNSGTATRLILARYLSTGAIDTTFGINGYVLYDIPFTTQANRNSVTELVQSPNGESIYLMAKNYDNSIIIKYSNPSLSNQNFELNNLKIYPNPVKDILNISLDSPIGSIVVYNLLGQELISKTVNANQSNIDLRDLTSGTYLVKVASSKGVKTIKIVKD